jgi:ABC-type amino acid transport substrate-binding protein
VPYDSIIPLVEANKYDCAIAAITITPQREAHVNFSDPYYDNKGKAIVTKVGSPIQGPADLAGRKIGISGEGAWYYTELGVSGVNPSDINTFYLPRDALLAVSNNVIDAAVGDYALLYPLARQYPDEYAIAPGYLTKVEYFGIAINKDRPGLTIAVDRALDRIKADGRYQNIYDRWLS